MANDLCEKDYSIFIEITQEDDDEHGTPFNDSDLKKLWDTKENDVSEMLLIMCYSGFRITEYRSLEVNLEEKYFYGGIKTTAGKNRMVPIHTAIFPLVECRIKRQKKLLLISNHNFRLEMYGWLENLGTVSYTHLDVYKRQILGSFKLFETTFLKSLPLPLLLLVLDYPFPLF